MCSWCLHKDSGQKGATTFTGTIRQQSGGNVQWGRAIELGFSHRLLVQVPDHLHSTCMHLEGMPYNCMLAQ